MRVRAETVRVAKKLEPGLERARSDNKALQENMRVVEDELAKTKEAALVAEQKVAESNRRIVDLQSEVEQLQTSLEKATKDMPLQETKQKERIDQLESQLQEAKEQSKARGNDAKETLVQIQLADEQGKNQDEKWMLCARSVMIFVNHLGMMRKQLKWKCNVWASLRLRNWKRWA